MKTKNISAFTLIEVLIVVAILALITAVGLPTINNSLREAETRIKQTNVASIEAAKEQWALLNNKPNGTSVLWEDIEDYMGLGILSLDDLEVNEDPITINPIGTQANY